MCSSVPCSSVSLVDTFRQCVREQPLRHRKRGRAAFGQCVREQPLRHWKRGRSAFRLCIRELPLRQRNRGRSVFRQCIREQPLRQWKRGRSAFGQYVREQPLRKQMRESPAFSVGGSVNSKAGLHRLSRTYKQGSNKMQKITEDKGGFPLFDQPGIRSKTKNFHVRLAAVQVPRCVTCSEKFPGLTVRVTSPDSNKTECVHCRQDKHITKLHCSANNMNPDPL